MPYSITEFLKRNRTIKNKGKKINTLLSKRGIQGLIYYDRHYRSWMLRAPNGHLDRLGIYLEAVKMIENGTLDFIKEL